MAANGHAQTGKSYPPGHWGKWRGVICSEDGCDAPAKCKGMCMSHYNKSRWAAGHRSPSVNPESRRTARIKHRYGLAPADYDRMYAAQNGLCAVCGEPPSDQNTRAHWSGKLCVDHDHNTGQLRGLLCNDCNLAVGYGRTPERLERAAEYLRRRAG